MKYFYGTLILFLFPVLLLAQLSVVSVDPANNAKNVPLNITLSITFNEPLDTVAMNNAGEDSWFTNLDSTVSWGYSADAKTAWTTHVLKPNKSYFYAFMYAKAKSGAVLTTPHVYYFTTGAEFNPYSVSGTVARGTVDIDPAGAVVALTTVNVMTTETDGPPPFAGWANVNANGTFTIPYIANGTYWPIVAKDMNGDGRLDPGLERDVVVFGDSIVVNNASLTNVALTFFSVVSVQPANNATNVPLNTTISITFSEPLDQDALMDSRDAMFSSIDSVSDFGFSADGKTLWSTVVLKPNTTYFLAFMYVRANTGLAMTKPQVYYFTTGASFPTTTVSGTVSAGSSGATPAGAIVGLAKIDLLNEKTEGPPPFGGWGMVEANGTFTIPYVANGTYWPLAAKDVNGDGELDPDNGVDVMAFGDSIVVNNASVTGVNLTFFTLHPNSYHQIVQTADSIAAADLPADRSLRRISAWEVDTLGQARTWEFAYSVNNNTQGKIVRIGTMDRQVEDMDMGYFQWVRDMKPITGLAQVASSATVIANVEAAGGRQVRLNPIPPQWEFRIELSMSNQKNMWFGGQPGVDTNKTYWAAAYAYSYQVSPDRSDWMGGMMYLCDQQTGAVLKTQQIFMDVKERAGVPEAYELAQNYPNPFNPVTNISYALPRAGMATLTVYDLLGKEVAVLVNERKDAGSYTVPFNAAALPSGVYFYRLQSGAFTQTKKMLLLK